MFLTNKLFRDLLICWKDLLNFFFFFIKIRPVEKIWCWVALTFHYLFRFGQQIKNVHEWTRAPKTLKSRPIRTLYVLHGTTRFSKITSIDRLFNYVSTVTGIRVLHFLGEGTTCSIRRLTGLEITPLVNSLWKSDVSYFVVRKKYMA